MSVTASTRVKLPRNGVDTPNLLATVNAVGQQPDLAKFQFRASNTWISGAHNRTTIDGFYGAGQELKHATPASYDVDHPAAPSERTTPRRPWSFSCMRWRRASRPGSPTSRRPAA